MTPTLRRVLLTASPQRQSWFPQNRKVAFYTDSMGSPSGASTYNLGHPWQALIFAGNLHHPHSLIRVRDYAGANATSISASAMANIDSDAPNVAVLQAGTNADADQAAFEAAVTNFVRGCNRRSIFAVVTAAIPKAAAQGTTERDRLSAQRDWLVANAGVLGFTLADAWAEVQVSAYMPANCDSGDGVHPNNRGHAKIARVEGAAIKSSMRQATSLVGALIGSNLVSNGLMVGALGTGSPSGWFAGTPTSTGTTPTYTKIAAPGDGFVTAGQGQELDINAASDTSWRRAIAAASGFATGDKLLLTMKLRVDPMAEDWEGLAAVSNTAKASYMLSNGISGTALAVGDYTAALNIDNGIIYTVGSGVTSLLVQINSVVPSGGHVKIAGYEVGLFNLTALGLSGLVRN